MTSSGGTPSVPNIVWDKSRLHGDKAAHNRAHALKSASSREATRRTTTTTSMPSTTTTTTTANIPPGRPRFSESELRMSFDPMKDLHMWTMWRVAVNGRIVDETRRRNRAQPTEGGDFDPNPYGRALMKTPLDRFIQVSNGSQNIAGVMMDPDGKGSGTLGTRQFVYYGVPRVVLKKPKNKVSLPE